MVVVMVCGGEGVSGDVAGVGSRMIVAPRSTAERWWFMIWWMVKDVNCAFFMLAPEFSNEGEVSRTIKRPLCLVNELV